MSMATPRRRARWWVVVRRVLAVVVALGVVGGAVYAAWHYLVRPGAQGQMACPTPTATTGAPPFTPVAAARIRVNVFNSTQRDGLAASVARELRQRGFRVAAVANDPRRRKVSAAAEVRHGPRGYAQARTLAAHVEGPVVLAPDRRADASVDLALGTGWRRTRPPAAAAAALRAAAAAAARARSSPRPVPTSPPPGTCP